MSDSSKRDSWSSKTGVILAVAGSAVGLGNFLKFPGQAAQFGGGAFMLAYFISLLILALPVAWAEWTMGRMGGQKGFSSCPGIFSTIYKHPIGKYLGILGVLVPLVIFMYLSYLASWCFGYSFNFLTNDLHFSNISQSTNYWANFIGANADGSAVGFGKHQVGLYFIVILAIIFTLLYRGISKGIELFCKYSIPALILVALVVLARILTLSPPNPEKPENNVLNGLGYMWNPTKTFLESNSNGSWIRQQELVDPSLIQQAKSLAQNNPHSHRVVEITPLQQLKQPKLWLAAASQIFFSLSAGIGIVITYASYMKKDDDVVLSSLTAASANEFTEVGMGGLMTLTAGFVFLGTAGVAGQGVFGLGFKVLPLVFSLMPFGNFFGFLFFFLLFLAATNGSISCVQPTIAFFEESLKIGRKTSIAILSIIAFWGCSFVIYFSKDAKALDTLDFWAANLLVFIIATIQLITFAWIIGVDKGFQETHKGAALRIPSIFKFITKYIAPTFLLSIFSLWIIIDVIGFGKQSIDSHILDLTGSSSTPPSPVAWLSIGMILILALAMAIIISRSPKFKNPNHPNSNQP